MIKLFSVLLLTSACGVVVTAQPSSQGASSTDPSPVQQSAQALISELEAPMNCSPTDTLCFAETGQKRLDAAIAGLKSIVRIDKSREAVVADLNTRIEIRGAIIDDLKRVDTNNQTIDANQQRNAALYEGIIRDDKAKIGKLEDKLESCQGRQKWIALVSFGGGLYVGNRLANDQPLNPFSSFSAQSGVKGYPLSFYEQTNTEKKLREMLRK